MSTPDPAEGRTLEYLASIPVEKVKGVGPKSASVLSTQGIRSVADLLLTAPRRYLDRSHLFDIAAAPLSEEVTVGGTVRSFSKRRISRGRTMVQATISDGTSAISAVWFNPYVTLTVGEEVALSGKIEPFRTGWQMKSPDVDRLSGPESLVTGRVVPVYGGLGGMKPFRTRAAVANAVRRSLPIRDVVPDEVLDRLDLVDRSFAIERIHFPESLDDVAPARRRLVFDEFLRIQMALRVRAHDHFETRAGVANSVRGPLFERYLAAQPFTLTPDQERALDDILANMAEPAPLHRLLQGEVGSGKTVVVIAALLTSVESGHQGAVMAPTEVLATQHYLGTRRALEDAGLAPVVDADDGLGTSSLFGEQEAATRSVRIGLFTGGRVAVNFRSGDVGREQGLAWLADGTIDIAFGTHALIQPDVAFHSLGITVVDEQHRFGVEQRVRLRERSGSEGVPDLLLMTATPIPRTLVMALYGDLDVSTIVTMPPGRAPITTEAGEIGPGTEDEVSERIREAVAAGNQAFVVCPLVDDSDAIDARSATTEFERLRRALDANVGLLHGQMASEDKASVMTAFRRGDLDVLVSTTVIEVGIDVPNATLMIVWNAERFGLSQLHQLRGRVGRGAHGGACVLLADPATPDAERRMGAMVATTDGFAIAEADLEIRGHGTLFGASQSGSGDLRFGDILRDADLIEAAAAVAREAVDTDRDGAFVTAVTAEFGAFLGDADEWLGRS
jgi:ATP-dependent DNA helicase RecG